MLSNISNTNGGWFVGEPWKYSALWWEIKYVCVNILLFNVLGHGSRPYPYEFLQPSKGQVRCIQYTITITIYYCSI
jgi:hypothetical protein